MIFCNSWIVVLLSVLTYVSVGAFLRVSSFFPQKLYFVNLYHRVYSIYWSEVLNTSGVQAKTDQFYALLNEAIETHFPLVSAKRHETDKPWMTQKIKNLISDRQAAFMQGNTAEWKILRNKIKRLIEQAKQNTMLIE